MSDNQEQQETPVFNIQRVYLKDLSLELPNAPQIFLETEQPAVEVAIDVGAQALADTVFEVTVTATVTTKVGDKVLYLVEGKQAGIFELANLPLEQLDPILGIVCPGIIYPYLRSNVADAISRASMAPLHLAEVNFQAIYEQRVAAAAEQQAAAEGADSGLVLPAGVANGVKH